MIAYLEIVIFPLGAVHVAHIPAVSVHTAFLFTAVVHADGLFHMGRQILNGGQVNNTVG